MYTSTCFGEISKHLHVYANKLMEIIILDTALWGGWGWRGEGGGREAGREGEEREREGGGGDGQIDKHTDRQSNRQTERKQSTKKQHVPSILFFNANANFMTAPTTVCLKVMSALSTSNFCE